MHEGQQNQRADRGYSHCHEGARGHHVCARHACAPRPRTKGLGVRWCGAHGTVAHAQRGLGLCMRGLVWPSWSATNTPKHLSIFRVALLTNTMACLCAGAACMHAAAPQSVATMISLSNGRFMVGAQLPPMRTSTWPATAQAQSQAAKHRPPSLSASTC